MVFQKISMRRIALRVARWLVLQRVMLAIVAILLAVWSVERSRHLLFVRSIDTMFDRTDPALGPYRRLARMFGGNEIVLAAYEDAELFTTAGIDRLRVVSQTLASLDGIKSCTSLADTPLGPRIIELEQSPTARRLVKLMEGYTLGEDHRTVAVICLLDSPASEQTSRADVIDSIRLVVSELPRGTVAGEPVMLRDGFSMLERDGNLLGLVSAMLSGGVIFICFRSIRWLLIPLAVVLLSLWSTRGVLAVLGLKLTMVSTMLSAMITVVAIATIVHVIVEFRRQRDAGAAPEQALEHSIAVLFWPTIGAIATDVIGFGSLIASRVGPVHDFGIMTAIGALMVLVSAALVVPFLTLVGRFGCDPLRAWGEGSLENGLDRLVKRLLGCPRRVLAVFVMVVLVAVAGMSRLEVETDFTKNFRSSSPIVASYEMIETRLGGAGMIDLLVPFSDKVGADLLGRVSRLENRLRKLVVPSEVDGESEPSLTKVMSVVDVLEAISPVSIERLESTRLGGWLLESAIEMLRTQLPQLGESLIGRDPTDGSQWLRVMLRAKERQSAATKRQIIDSVSKIVNEEIVPVENHSGEVTGFFVLLSQLVERMLSDQWYTFALASVGIFLLLAVAFRNVAVAAVALVPNAVPIFVVLGMLGWCGIRVNMGTAMIAAVSMGLSVDSSIHYIAAFRRRMSEGFGIEAALETAHQTAGRAMIFSTLALVVGFLALVSSGFIPTVSFGVLSCLTLSGGLIGNLVVLPVLLAMLGDWAKPFNGKVHEKRDVLVEHQI